MPLGRTRIRRVTSRGHQYAQEVLYEWDSRRGRGVTRVLRVLGPLTPVRRPTVGAVDPQVIADRIAAQTRSRDQSRESPGRSGRGPMPRTLPPPPRNQPGTSPRLGHTSAEVLSAFPLTGDRGLERFDTRILALIRQHRRGATRAAIFKAASKARVARPSPDQSLRRHISFAITRLFRRRLLSRFGEGGARDPVMWVPPSLR